MDVGQSVGAVALRAGGGFVFALRDGFAVADSFGGPLSLVAEVEKDLPHHRMNDGKCDRAGRFFAGSMADAETPEAGSFYRLDGQGRATAMFGGVTISNGLCWNADETAMFYIDSPSRGSTCSTTTPPRGRYRIVVCSSRFPSSWDAGRHDHRRRGLSLDRALGWGSGSSLHAARDESIGSRGPRELGDQLLVRRSRSFRALYYDRVDRFDRRATRPAATRGCGLRRANHDERGSRPSLSRLTGDRVHRVTLAVTNLYQEVTVPAGQFELFAQRRSRASTCLASLGFSMATKISALSQATRSLRGPSRVYGALDRGASGDRVARARVHFGQPTRRVVVVGEIAFACSSMGSASSG